MRAALRDSLAGALRETVTYPKGSVVVCTSCAKPIYKLERGIGAGEPAGRAATAFRPVSVLDLIDLRGRRSWSIEPGLLAVLRRWTYPDMVAHVQRLTDPKAGDPMLCPACGDVFAHARSAERADTQDRAYVIELLTVPPGVV